MNICGCVIHLAPAHREVGMAALAAMDGVEIHGAGDDGRLVVVVEDTATDTASAIIMAMHQIPGVLSVTLNYHHFEDLSPPRGPANHQSPRTDA